MKDKAVGFYFTIIAAILSIEGMILYYTVMYTMPVVYVFCGVAVGLTTVVVICSLKGKNLPLIQLVPVINAVLMASAAVWGVRLMVNQIGYVIAELDEKSTIMGLIYFEAVAVLSMIMNIIASFLKQIKD